jgi:hypothetical protein
MTSHFDETTGEHVIHLVNGFEIRSGWIDHDDPDALPAGDYLSVISGDGEQLFYVDSADLLADPLTGRQKLNELFTICCGVLHDTNIDIEIGEASEG